jgi:hypothetical protein
MLSERALLARNVISGVLPLADTDLGSLMDMVYQQDDILEFAYRISKGLPGQ